MRYFVICKNCDHMEKRHEPSTLICPSCDDQIEMDEVEPLTDGEITEAFEYYLDEAYGEINICGHEYAASVALKSVDPIAFRCRESDWLDAQCRDNIYREFLGEYFEVKN